MDPSLQQSVDQPLTKRYSVRRAIIVVITTCIAFGLMAVAVWFVRTKPSNPDVGTSAASNYPVASVPISSLPSLPAQTQTTQLVVNGQAQVTNGLVLQPSTTKPASAVAGELYYDKATNRPYFYNGTSFISLQSSGTTVQVTNNSTTVQQTIVQGGGTELSGLIPNGIAFADTATTLQTTASVSNSILATDGSGVPGLAQTLPVGVQQNITATGTLTQGSIASGFGAINTANNITTSAMAQAGQLQVNGVGTISTDNTAAFQVQDASNNKLFTVDTTNTQIVLGNDGAPSNVTVRGATASGNSVTGANLTFDAANGTGLGGSGDFIFRTAPALNTAITLDTSAYVGDVGSNHSDSVNLTLNAHNNRLLIVGLGIKEASGTDDISTVTYGGVNLTRLGRTPCPAAAQCTTEVWYLPESSMPANGTKALVATLKAGKNHNMFLGGSIFYNVDQSGAPSIGNTATGTGDPVTITTASSTNQVVVDTVVNDNNPFTTPSAGQTELWDDGGGGLNYGDGSYKSAGASSTTMSWTAFGAGNWADMAIILNPVVGTAPDVLTDRLHITAAGNIGINTSSPQYTLDVGGNGNFKVTSAAAFQIQNASGSLLFVANTSTMTVTVAALSITGALTLNGHVITGGTAPGIAAGVAACTTPVVAVVGNDTAGQISVTTGTGCGGAGVLATLTFHSAYSAVPHAQITPKNAVAAALLPYQSSTTTVLTLGVANAPTNSTTYLFDYLVTQ